METIDSPNIEPGPKKGRLVYDNKRRTIVAVRDPWWQRLRAWFKRNSY